MNTIKTNVTLVLAICILLFGVAQSHAGQVVVGIGFSSSPYVIKVEDAGIEVDIIREAFKAVGHDASFIYLPNLRLPVAFAQKSVDCIASNVAYDLTGESGEFAFPSDTTVVYHNYAITLASRGLHIDSIQDLKNKKVLGFNNAAKYLGQEYAVMAGNNSHYFELADQALQVRMLCSGRIDVAVADKRVFLYWRKQLVRFDADKFIELNQEVAFHAIFPSAPRDVSFRDEKMREDFNKGLSLLKRNGAIERIKMEYASAG